MRIRLPFAGGFFVLLLLAGYLGLSSVTLNGFIDDKLLHLLTFFLLTVTFYWILDTNRRRTLNLTLIVCTAGLGVGSEFLQDLVATDRDFQIYDIVANIVGSLAGLGLCSWYHKRMLERKRQRKQYNAVSGEDPESGEGEDLELGEGVGGGDHEEGVTEGGGAADSTGAGTRSMSLEEEIDNWDENAVDAWEEDDLGDVGASASPAKGQEADMNGDATESKKRDS